MLSIGIDLGTTASVIASIKDGKPYVIPMENGEVTTPSVVNYSNEYPIVGKRAILEGGSAIFSVKRSMGQRTKFFEKFPEEISAEILKHICKNAELHLGEKIETAVITVPAHFSEAQRMATKHAASLAGIKVLRLINEPTAAALAFGLEKNGIFAVYDLGGGTFDFSVLRLRDGIFQVLATGGDNFLGGDDIDNEILNYNLNRLGIDEINEKERAIGKLVAKSLKEKLSSGETTQKFLHEGRSYEFHLTEKILEDLSHQFLQKTLDVADRVLHDAKISQLDGVVLVGGMTKLPLVKSVIKHHFSATIFDNVNPDEAVALGAALQAEMINSKNSNLLLIDVVPLTLGMETLGGNVDKIIYRNTPIPIAEQREYTTYKDNQFGMKFHIVQGESPLAENCRSLAHFELKEIPPMPAGMPRIVVTFSVDINGLLTVTALEKNTGQQQSVLVEPSSGLSGDEIFSLLEQSLKNKKNDDAQAQKISTIVETKRIINFWNSILEEIPEKDRADICTKISALEELIGQDKVEKKNTEISEIVERRREIEIRIARHMDAIINNRLSGKNFSKFFERAI